jgi:hypothetical protein
MLMLLQVLLLSALLALFLFLFRSFRICSSYEVEESPRGQTQGEVFHSDKYLRLKGDKTPLILQSTARTVTESFPSPLHV